MFLFLKKTVFHILILPFELLMNIQRCEISYPRASLSWGLARGVWRAEPERPPLLVPTESVTQLFADYNSTWYILASVALFFVSPRVW